MSYLLQNANDNQLCSVFVDTTGPDYYEHDILQISIILLNTDLKPESGHLPLIMDLKPRRPQNINLKSRIQGRKERICSAMLRGIDYYTGAEYFVEWFEKLNLAWKKRLMPIVFNWPFHKGFIVDWLGLKTFDLCFHWHIRDIMAAALLRNDRSGWLSRDFPYPKVNLTYLANVMRIERPKPHTSISEARVIAEIYKRLVQEYQ